MANGKNTKQSTQTTTTPAAAPAPVVADKAEKKAASKKTTEKKEEVVSTPAPVAEKKAASKKTEKKEEAVAAPVEAVASVAEESEEKKARRQVSKQSVYDDFVQLITKIQEEIDKRAPAAPVAEDGAASASKKTKRKKDVGVPIKFLRSINKRLATLQSDATKMMKLKTKTTRNNENSGLMKPVKISDTLFNFLKSTGFEIEKDKKYPRVEITKNIHQYVSKNDLRDPQDKRTILPDAKLAALLNYDAATAKDKMTYFRLPQYLKSHFISEPKA